MAATDERSRAPCGGLSHVTFRTLRGEPLNRCVLAADTPDVPSAGEEMQRELARAYGEYRGAMTAWRAAGKFADAETAERAADRLLRARVRLYRQLVATGWAPPAAVEIQLDRDAALVAAPDDFEALLAV